MLEITLIGFCVMIVSELINGGWHPMGKGIVMLVEIAFYVLLYIGRR